MLVGTFLIFLLFLLVQLIGVLLLSPFHFLNYNGAHLESIDDHPKAAHNLHGYILVDKYQIDERPSQLDWLGAKNKPSNLEDRYKLHVQDPKQRHVLHVVVIREVIEQVAVRAPGKVTITGQYNFDPEVRGTSLARPKDKGVYVGPSLGYN